MLEKRMCDECGKRPAVYYMKKTLNGVTTERYLCEECRNKMGFLQPDMSDFGNMLFRQSFLRYRSSQAAGGKDLPDVRLHLAAVP